MADYGKPTAESQSISVDKPNHYPGADVMASGHNLGDASDARSERGKKNRQGSYKGQRGKGKKMKAATY